MAEVQGTLICPWDTITMLPLFASRYQGMRSEDISDQAAEYRVAPEPNLCTFRFWCGEDGLDLLEADEDIEVLTSEVMDREMP